MSGVFVGVVLWEDDSAVLCFQGYVVVSEDILVWEGRVVFL